ncbi:MAG: hypothetical protein K2K26_11940 [Muribaculaceae bacterium]|nr:hypothetical protein [Muribaculaceae bacterium]
MAFEINEVSEDYIIPSNEEIYLFKGSGIDEHYCPDWQNVELELKACENYTVYPSGSLEYQQQWENADQVIKTEVSNVLIANDWISWEAVKDSQSFSLKLIVKENNTNKQRAARLSFVEFFPPSHDYCFVDLVIVQKAAVDPTPFKVKLRYKGKLYETEASLNENEELIFQNDEVSELMAMLRAKPDVETVLMDSEIVDFIDKEDLDKEPRLVALAARDGMQRVTCPSHPRKLECRFPFYGNWCGRLLCIV